MGQMVNFQDAARARQKSGLPEELLRAWQPPATDRRSPKSDDWSSTNGAGTQVRRLRRPLALLAAAAVVIAGASIAAVELTSHGNPLSSTGTGSGGAPKFAAPARYHARGFPFVASFPSKPTVSHQKLHLLRLPYTATTYTAQDGSTSISVGVYPLPVGNPLNYHLHQFVHAFVNTSGTAPAGATVHAGAVSTFQGVKAVSLAGTADGGTSAGFGLIVLDGHVAYEILAIGPSSSVDSTFRSALKHFRIVKPSLGFTF